MVAGDIEEVFGGAFVFGDGEEDGVGVGSGDFVTNNSNLYPSLSIPALRQRHRSRLSRRSQLHLPRLPPSKICFVNTHLGRPRNRQRPPLRHLPNPIQQSIHTLMSVISQLLNRLPDGRASNQNPICRQKLFSIPLHIAWAEAVPEIVRRDLRPNPPSPVHRKDDVRRSVAVGYATTRDITKEEQWKLRIPCSAAFPCTRFLSRPIFGAERVNVVAKTLPAIPEVTFFSVALSSRTPFSICKYRFRGSGITVRSMTGAGGWGFDPSGRKPADTAADHNLTNCIELNPSQAV
ncbi:hypothetical protein M5K25_009631 [Dendrobium thyrsiflorum]|uniref:Uncharacterized protein n=1 Tax=Dendrobium thyrsiflorum TaxID=117978 RepID=A0ABD0V705_DENTH